RDLILDRPAQATAEIDPRPGDVQVGDHGEHVRPRIDPRVDLELAVESEFVLLVLRLEYIAVPRCIILVIEPTQGRPFPGRGPARAAGRRGSQGTRDGRFGFAAAGVRA